MAAHEILFNDPALRSLKRQQLVQLCKRYGLKASGKNTELQQRLQDYGTTLSIRQRQENANDTTSNSHHLDDPSDDSSDSSDSESDTQGREIGSSTLEQPLVRTTPMLSHHHQSVTRDSTGSDTWDLLDRSSELEDSEIRQSRHGAGGGPQWKSAVNGGGSDNVDVPQGATQDGHETILRGKSLRSRVGSIRAAGSSLNLRLRNASSSSLGSLSLKRKASSLLPHSGGEKSTPLVPSGLARLAMGEMQAGLLAAENEESSLPVSTRSVGIPKRHGHMLGSTVPSTIRLVTRNTEPAHTTPVSLRSEKNADGSNQTRTDLVEDVKATHGLKPFCRYPIKSSSSTRRKSPEKQVEPGCTSTSRRANQQNQVATPPSSRAREIFSGSATMTTPIYPDLPSDADEEPDLPIPGAFPTPTSSRRRQQQQQQPTPEPFVFGSTSSSAGISNDQFGMAGDAVLEEMNRKLRERGIVPIGQEMDRDQVLRTKGRNRGLSGNSLMVTGDKKGRGRFDDAHARQFAKMPSIGSGWKGRGTTNTRTTATSAAKSKNPLAKTKDIATTTVGGAIMTPGKRKAGEMMVDTSTDSTTETIARGAAHQRQFTEMTVEDSPRVKRAKTGSQAVSSGVAGVPRMALPVAAAGNEVALKSRLGFLAASANSVKGTFSAIQDRLSNDREAVARKNGEPITSRTLQQQQEQRQAQPQKIAKSQSGFFGLSATSSSGSLGGRHRSELDLHQLSTQSANNRLVKGLSTISSTTTSIQLPTEAPATGLSLAYDLHVRKSKSSHALNAFGSSAGTDIPLQKATRMLSGGVATVSRPAPPPPPFQAPNEGSPLHSSVNHTIVKAQDFSRSLSKPLKAPPRTISKSYSSNLLRPTASSLARMQATIPPPSSRPGATPAAAKSFPVPSYQDSPTFSRINTMGSAAVLPTPRAVVPQTATPSKKLAHLVPKSPHRRAMERHTAAGRVAGGTGGSMGGLKAKTFQARLTMGQKQREIEERRRARLDGGKMVF
ncbi:hypothetical protein QFC22_001078 [Naganishia vaughanmartiniae]|uniref:Uncharacterized protein n=1 Tax=Naganishia vaughanmartiniae TaxID=1424756 RepID=A0ACC2XKW9_9TREE|nr:hypothetical protein QFC22_001078 [Naganishia vaughanmartiniae]